MVGNNSTNELDSRQISTHYNPRIDVTKTGIISLMIKVNVAQKQNIPQQIHTTNILSHLKINKSLT